MQKTSYKDHMDNKILKHIIGGASGLKWLLTNRVVSWIPSQHLKFFFLKMLGVKLTKNVKLYHGFQVRNPKGLIIEDGVSIGPKVLLDARSGLTIKRSAIIAYGAIIWTMNHDYNDVNFCGKGGPVEICEYAWVCSRSIILPGIKIGKGAVVASGAIVTKDVPDFAVVAGVPAKIVGTRKDQEYKYGYAHHCDYNHFQ